MRFSSRETRAPSSLPLCIPDHGLHLFLLLLLLRLLLLLHTCSPASAQLPIPPPPSPSRSEPVYEVRFDKSMAIILVILVVVFFALGFVSVYSRQCAERRFRGTNHLGLPTGNSDHHLRGLDPEIIRTFPTFLYSTVKGLKLGTSALECAVCLNEFQDHETLRFLPKCSHVFHPHCIDLWLSSHSTCPVCRANLAPTPGDISFVAVQIPDSAIEPDPRPESEDRHDRDIIQLDQDNSNRVADSSPKNMDVINLIDRNQNPPPRSRSTGFRIASLFPRSHSTGHSLISQRVNSERFTLRLPEEVRKELLNPTLKSSVTFTRMGSERRGYRTRSVGSGGGGSYLQHQRSDRWGFTWTPPFINRSGSSSSRKPHPNSSEVAMDNLEERSTDRLCPQPED